MPTEYSTFSVKTSPNTAYDIQIRRSERAKRMSLKIDAANRRAELVMPSGTDLSKGKAFAQQNAEWLKRHLEALPNQVSFAPGCVIPFCGIETKLIHCPNQSGAVRFDPETAHLHVAGPIHGFEARITRYLKTQARLSLLKQTEIIARAMHVTPNIVRLKDTKSRWASCSSKGGLNYSWRLIFAPPAILRYVVVHECAHLIEMNHSAAFWAIVTHHDPNWQTHRAWLRRNGARLHAIG